MGENLVDNSKVKFVDPEQLKYISAYLERIKDLSSKSDERVLRFLKLVDPTCLALDDQSLSHNQILTIRWKVPFHETLYDLSLQNAQLTDDQIAIISEWITGASGLRILSLAKNFITSVGLQSLIHGLKHHSLLTALFLDQNRLEVSGAKDLSQLLLSNEQLLTLGVSENIFGDEGIQQFAISLLETRKQFKLVQLNLSGNAITCNGLQHLSLLVQSLPDVESLFLADNLISENGFFLWTTSLAEMKNISEIDISGNKMSKEALENLLEVVREIPTIKILRCTSRESLSHNDFYVSQLRICYTRGDTQDYNP